MLKKLFCCVLLILLCAGCDNGARPKLGISFGVGGASRWPMEIAMMEKRAKELGMDVDARLNKTDTPKTQTEDCFEMIDNGAKVIILVPRDTRKTDEILDYARQKNVKVLTYARAIMGKKMDFFVGYDTNKIGQNLGLHLSEKVYKGNIAILKGDANDFNTPLLHNGAMKHIQPLVDQGDVNIILDEYVKNWSPELARKALTEAIRKNNNKIDAVLAQNDLLAGVASEVIRDMGIKNHVLIVGMDAELSALKRLANGQQDATVHMDLAELAVNAADEAYNMATGKKSNTNASFDNQSGQNIPSYLINGRIITRENLDNMIIARGIFTREDIYGKKP